MILYVLDRSYNTIGAPLDTWTTAMWYVRYNEEGEMSIYLPASFGMANKDILKRDNYITNPRFPNHYCIIESIETTTDFEEGPQMVISGRSLESILRRRVIRDKKYFNNASLQDAIYSVLLSNIIAPSQSERRIPNFVFKRSSDSRITSIRITENLHGENIYDWIQAECTEYGLGFRITPYGEGGFQFELYMGADHSYAQDTLPWVVFSPGYENLGSTKNVESSMKLQNAAVVYNIHQISYEEEVIDYDDDGNPTGHHTETKYRDLETTVDVTGSGTPATGLDRRELFLDSSVSSKDDNNEELPIAQFRTVLYGEGQKEIAEHELESVYTGEAEVTRQFVLGKDFELGDVVQFVNEFKQEGQLRISEIIHSDDADGDIITPTFVNI